MPVIMKKPTKCFSGKLFKLCLEWNMVILLNIWIDNETGNIYSFSSKLAPRSAVCKETKMRLKYIIINNCKTETLLMQDG